jgi:tRNA (cytidine/uridine-2'-O-)-methyltransferase
MGATLRLCACLGISLDVIEPCGFVWDDRKLDRAAMDYRDQCDLTRHADWRRFLDSKNGRVVLLTTKPDKDLYDF